ncbi:diaminobutyrate-2-oxoglutarate transaminase [Azospirillum soli]|nr:diaminobutyrate-2-oxoglutarate transaminase [Azospirillum soli]
MAYLADDGIAHGLDMHTAAKGRFIEAFEAFAAARTRGKYRLMFPGPTGTNAVEAAIKLARKVTRRTAVGAFTNGFHGMTLGALAATGSTSKRRGAGIVLSGVDRYPYDGYFGPETDTIALIERYLQDPSSGFDVPAAFVVETVQGEGGLNVASTAWLRRLTALCRRWGILLIVDDIQAGCGRTGPFFSWEDAGIDPDIVCLSKSLSGFGLPLSMLMIREDIDQWQPGEHNGTFRGNNHAFVTAAAALELWDDPAFRANQEALTAQLDRWIDETVAALGSHGLAARGRGLMRGIATAGDEVADAICAEVFQRGVIVETSGPHGEVVKFMPPLTTRPDRLATALDHLSEAFASALATTPDTLPAMAG